MKHYFKYLQLLAIFLCLAVPVVGRAAAESNAVPAKVEPTPGPQPLLPAQHAIGLNGIIDNLIAALKQLESTESANQVRFQASEKSAAQRNDDLMASINKDLHHLEQMLTNLANEAPKSKAMETAALGAAGQTNSTKGHSKSYMAKLLAGYQGKTRTSPTANSLVGGLNLAVAEACENGCVSPEEAEAISSGNDPKIPCTSDPEVAGSWTDPSKLNSMADGPSKCIDAAPNSKAMKCLGAFMHLMSVGEDIGRGDKFNPAQAITASLGKGKIADHVSCKISKILDNICLPQSAGGNPEEIKAQIDLAKKYGVDCALNGKDPSPSCKRQLRAAAIKAGIGETAKGQNTPPGQKVESLNGLMGQAINQAEAGEKAAAEGGAGCGEGDPTGVQQRVVEFLNRDDVKKYMASAEFAKNVSIETAWLPTMYGDIQYAMDEWMKMYDNQHPYVMMADVWIKDLAEEQSIQFATNQRRELQKRNAQLAMLQQSKSCNISTASNRLEQAIATLTKPQASPISANVAK